MSLCFAAGKSPEKLFDRAGKLADSNVQIINYTVDASTKWCLLAGISTQDKKTIDGHLQLYSVERQQQQFLDGHAGCFGTLVVSPHTVYNTTIQSFTLFASSMNQNHPLMSSPLLNGKMDNSKFTLWTFILLVVKVILHPSKLLQSLPSHLKLPSISQFMNMSVNFIFPCYSQTFLLIFSVEFQTWRHLFSFSWRFHHCSRRFNRDLNLSP